MVVLEGGDIIAELVLITCVCACVCVCACACYYLTRGRGTALRAADPVFPKICTDETAGETLDDIHRKGSICIYFLCAHAFV